MDVTFPIGELNVPEHASMQNVEKWLKEIEIYTIRLRGTVASLSDDEMNKTYRKGAWNVRQLVHHIADSQVNMYQRLKMALTENNPTLPVFNQDAWAVQPDTELPIKCSINILEGINERIVSLGYRLTEEQLDRVFTLQGNGTVSVFEKMAKLAWHEEHHLAHIKIALASQSY